MSKVRAKFKVDRFEVALSNRAIKDAEGRPTRDYEAVELRTVVFHPVYGNGDPQHENTRFWDATPTGEIKLGTLNPEAWQAFELGHEYYIDFTPAD